ncbi:hypothetical protein NDU88_003865 [Pleurodeles waltl]|uniref:Uncharacterized protein n=1 Tax=Pleurodeles waltl TaxID=8319 RepID=A0AAV7V175_PLEWA|nr:hypothetical protein NDU88_003865 [Pleurodeles waltl]
MPLCFSLGSTALKREKPRTAQVCPLFSSGASALQWGPEQNGRTGLPGPPRSPPHQLLRSRPYCASPPRDPPGRLPHLCGWLADCRAQNLTTRPGPPHTAPATSEPGVRPRGPASPPFASVGVPVSPQGAQCSPTPAAKPGRPGPQKSGVAGCSMGPGRQSSDKRVHSRCHLGHAPNENILITWA